VALAFYVLSRSAITRNIFDKYIKDNDNTITIDGFFSKIKHFAAKTLLEETTPTRNTKPIPEQKPGSKVEIISLGLPVVDKSRFITAGPCFNGCDYIVPNTSDINDAKSSLEIRTTNITPEPTIKLE
jgi:hypothetical protein